MKTNMTYFRPIGLLALVIAAFAASAQTPCKNNMPTDPALRAKLEENKVIYEDAMRSGNYRGSAASLQWILNNAPQWHTNAYIHGADIYDKLAGAEKDPAKKLALADSLMIIYDLRIKNCGDEINVLNRKAGYSAKYFSQNKERTESVLALFDRVFEISGNNVNDGNLELYMKVAQLNQALLKNLTEDQILARYDKISAVIEAKIQKAASENKQDQIEKLKTIKANVDDILVKLVTVDCPFVKKNLEPKFKANPNDAALANRIFMFMTKGGCIEDPLWLEAAEVVHKTTPDFGLAKNMAKVYAKNKNYDKADTYIAEAITLAKTPAEKADSYIIQGDLLSTRDQKSAARESYRKAIAADGSNKEGFEKIGDLYM
ncbi:MAG: tetratricopeptide repeat protein, partial [Cyclobacteriaceae bacterium]